jgi:hypothetical protein
MSAYDLKSYALALKLRSKKTILVEGPSDKKVLSRMLLEREQVQKKARNCVIDDVALLSREPKLSKLGNRARVEAVVQTLEAQCPNLNWLMDREWEGLDSAGARYTESGEGNDRGFRTRGHSIENYWFENQPLSGYIKQLHGHDLSADFFGVLDLRFPQMLLTAAAVSLVAGAENIISSMNSLVSRHHFSWDGSNYHPAPQLNIDAKLRHIEVDIVAKIIERQQIINSNSDSHDELRWICHGHIGEQVLRACAAHLAAESGAEEGVCAQIERGHHAIKLLHDADWLARAPVTQISPLDKLLDWGSSSA